MDRRNYIDGNIEDFLKYIEDAIEVVKITFNNALLKVDDKVCNTQVKLLHNKLNIKPNGIQIYINNLDLWAIDFDEFDRIYCMDQSNLKNILQFTDNDSHKEKVSLILDILENPNYTEVPDPYYGGREGFELVYKLLDEACEKIANDLKKHS